MKKSYVYAKYIFDRVAALFGILIGAPLFLFAAMLVASDGRGNVIFRQLRVGRGGKFFYIYKFRTMTSVSVGFSVDKALIAESDQNVTRFGKFLRKSKLDELPQLFNVLKGDMSFVGPRPLLPDYIGVYERWEFCKFRVRPGLTGLAQVSGNGYLPIAERSYYDIYYTENACVGMDLAILAKTLILVLKGEKSRQARVHQENMLQIREKYKDCRECDIYCRNALWQVLGYASGKRMKLKISEQHVVH
jgi:lipopolysaccharide/colanic/teichoic acid biosynthesis glycosyltransferase